MPATIRDYAERAGFFKAWERDMTDHLRLFAEAEPSDPENSNAFGDPLNDDDSEPIYDGKCKRVWRSLSERRLESGGLDAAAETKEFLPELPEGLTTDSNAKAPGLGGQTMRGDVVDINPTEGSITVRWDQT